MTTADAVALSAAVKWGLVGCFILGVGFTLGVALLAVFEALWRRWE